jgi:hypothetical protein
MFLVSRVLACTLAGRPNNGRYIIGVHGIGYIVWAYSWDTVVSSDSWLSFSQRTLLMGIYNSVQANVQKFSGFVAKTCWIADVRRSLGLPTKIARNRIDPKKPKHPCPPKRRPDIVAAHVRLRMISSGVISLKCKSGHQFYTEEMTKMAKRKPVEQPPQYSPGYIVGHWCVTRYHPDGRAMPDRRVFRWKEDAYRLAHEWRNAPRRPTVEQLT